MRPRLSVILADIYVLPGKILNAFPFFTCTKKQCAFEHSKAYPFPRAWHALALLILPISAMAQTTIVVRRTPTEIVAGADSRITNKTLTQDILGQPHISVTYSSTCKIVVAGNRAFVYSGYKGIDINSLDIVGMARTALETARTLNEAADFYGSGIRNQLRESLERLRLLNLESYRGSTRDPDGSVKDVSQVIFMAVENGIPKLAARSFTVTSDEMTPVSLTVVPVNIPNKAIPPNLTVTAFGGHHQEIDRYRDDAAFWLKHGNAGGILTLIATMEDTSDLVGGPIDILRVTKKGAEWVQHKQECPDIQNTSRKPVPKPTRRRPRR